MWDKNILHVGDCVLVQADPRSSYDDKIAIEDELKIHDIHVVVGGGMIELNFGDRTAILFSEGKAEWFSKRHMGMIEATKKSYMHELNFIKSVMDLVGIGIYAIFENRAEHAECKKNFVVAVSDEWWRR